MGINKDKYKLLSDSDMDNDDHDDDADKNAATMYVAIVDGCRQMVDGRRQTGVDRGLKMAIGSNLSWHF